MKSFYSWLESIHDKHLIIMRGLPGSGRTNKAKTLGIGGVIYSTDEYDFDEIKNDEEKNQHKTELAMRKGITPIVIDNMNIKAEDMKPYVKLGDMYGYKIKIELPDNGWAWEPKQLAVKNTKKIPQHVLEKMLDDFEHDVKLNKLRYEK